MAQFSMLFTTPFAEQLWKFNNKRQFGLSYEDFKDEIVLLSEKFGEMSMPPQEDTCQKVYGDAKEMLSRFSAAIQSWGFFISGSPMARFNRDDYIKEADAAMSNFKIHYDILLFEAGG